MNAFVTGIRVPHSPLEGTLHVHSYNAVHSKHGILAPRMSNAPFRPKLDESASVLKSPQYTVTGAADSLRPASDPKFQGTLPFAEEVDQFLNHPVTEIATAGFVLVSCGVFALETIEVSPVLDIALISIEKLISVLFFLEYVLRIYSKDFQVRFLFTRLMIIDFIAILPLFFYQFGSIAQFDLQFVRLLRVARVFRLQRILEKTEFRNIFGNVPTSRLKIAEILLTVFSLVYLSSGLYYDAEHDVNPKVGTFFDCVYYTIGMLSTVGFGPAPLTAAGRAVTAATVIVGALVVPFQLGALARATLGEMMTDNEQDDYSIGLEDDSELRRNLPQFRSDIQCSRCTLKLHQADAKFCRNCGAPLPDTALD